MRPFVCVGDAPENDVVLAIAAAVVGLERHDVAIDTVMGKSAEVDIDRFSRLDRAVGLNVEPEVEAFDDPPFVRPRARDREQQDDSAEDGPQADGHRPCLWCYRLVLVPL